MSTNTGNADGRMPGVYSAHPLAHGFPARSTTHGGFGWSSVWLVRDSHRVVLVETGPPAYVPLLTSGLSELGLTLDHVTDVLVTHAHWDHLANIALFPHARVWISGAELTWARSVELGQPFMSPLHVEELVRRGESVGTVGDGDAPLPGVQVVATPGHTPGHIAFEVKTTTGPTLFAGDAVKNVHELTTATAESTMDAPMSAGSIHRLRSRMVETGALLVPGHDVPLVMQQGVARRTRPQHADISWVADAARAHQDHSCHETSEPRPVP